MDDAIISGDICRGDGHAVVDDHAVTLNGDTEHFALDGLVLGGGRSNQVFGAKFIFKNVITQHGIQQFRHLQRTGLADAQLVKERGEGFIRRCEHSEGEALIQQLQAIGGDDDFFQNGEALTITGDPGDGGRREVNHLKQFTRRFGYQYRVDQMDDAVIRHDVGFDDGGTVIEHDHL